MEMQQQISTLGSPPSPEEISENIKKNINGDETTNLQKKYRKYQKNISASSEILKLSQSVLNLL